MPSTPWRAILTSPRVAVICITHTANNWCFYTILTSGPKFLRDVYNYALEANGLISTLPYVLSLIIMTASGRVADWTRASGKLTTLTTRRLFNSVGFGLQVYGRKKNRMYTAELVACHWAVAARQKPMDRQTDQPVNQWTNIKGYNNF